MSAIIALIIFIAAYAGFVLYSEKRVYIAIAGAILLLLTRAITPLEAFWSVNWNVMGIFVGMLVVSSIFTESKAPAYLAEVVVSRIKSLAIALLMICMITGFISAFVDNVSTVLIVAPFALSIAKRLKLDPTSMMIGIAVSSNLQGTATLIGDPPSMLLGGFAKMNFWDFFFYHGHPGIFFAVELGAIASFVVLYFIFKRKDAKINIKIFEKVRSWWPTIFLVTLVLMLACSSFIKGNYPYISGSLCMMVAVISLLWRKIIQKSSIRQKLKILDWETSIFLAAIFILVGSLTATGWISRFSLFLSQNIGGNVFAAYTLIVIVSVLLSAFIDNIPYLAAMLPVTISLAQNLQIEPALFMFGLLIGACLGGNITPIGASANIVACGILKKEGYKVSFLQFGRIGIPFTLSAVLIGYLFIWFIWR